MKIYIFGQFFCPSSGVYSLYTRHWYMPYRFEDSWYDIYQCRVYNEYTPNDGQRNCTKHVEFHAGENLGNWSIWLVLL